MQRMGIDFGSKKIGIALSDESGVMAFPHSVIPNDDKFLDKIEAIINERNVKEIVIGQSLNLDGSPNKIQAAIENLVMDLTLATGLPIHLEPEQYSSREATHITGKNKQIDAAAAAIILNSYLTKQKNI